MTFLSKVRLKRGTGSTGALVDILRDVGGATGEHKLIWTLFGATGDEQRDFLFRKSDAEGWLVLSERPPEDRHQVWDIKSKEFSPSLSTGQRLSFLLRANPKISTRDEKGRRVKHDAVMNARYGTRDAEGKLIPLSEVLPKAAYDWLAAQGARAGFMIEAKDVYADGYVQHRFAKSRGQSVTISSLDYKGILTVNEPEKFFCTLRSGFGGGRAYGFGMMMIGRDKLRE
jgi:CRISPR system Cascade subunit CasE